MRRVSIAVLLLLGIAASARGQGLFDQIPASIPGYDMRFGVPLLARAETRMRELGIDLGGARVQPAAEIGLGYDSNVRGEARARGSAFVNTAASLGVQRDFRDVTLAGYFRADDRRYFSQAAQSRTNWSATFGAGVELGGGRLNLSASHLALHQERTDLDSIPSDRPIAYRVEQARVSYAYRFNRLTLVPNAEFAIYRFSNTTIAGIPASQLYRDRQVARAGVGGRYELAEKRGIIFALGAANTRYQHAVINQPNRNSTDAVALIGMDSGGADPHADPWRYSVLAGVQARQFAAPGRAARIAPALDAQIHWQATGLTGLNLRVTRAIEDAAREGQSSAVLTRAKLVAEHEYACDLIFQVSGGVQLAEYDRASTGVSFNAGARVTWVINDLMRASLSYDFVRWREGVQDNAPQDGLRLRNLVLATLRLTP